jgi:hypothetical protein
MSTTSASALENVSGGALADTLRGNALANSLYGRGGNDKLYGEAGKDGLFGGGGYDELWGGAHADRFLLTGDSDWTDRASQDAAIDFIMGTADTDADGVARPSQAWTDREIERVDAALGVLHLSGRDAELLKTASDGVIRFARHGGFGRGSNDGTIHLTNAQVPGDASTSSTAENFLRGYVLHEIGHYWNGNQLGGTFWTRFQNISNWTITNPNNSAFARAAERLVSNEH